MTLDASARQRIERRTKSLEEHERRIRELEDRALLDDKLHRDYEAADGRTATAVDALAKAINDPRSGLIVELASFRAEVSADRATFKAWIAGAVAALGLIFTIVTAAAPYLQGLVGATP